MTYTMEQIWLMQRCGMFRDDMFERMEELGFSKDVIFAFCYSDAVKEKNLIKLWQDHGRDYPNEFHTYFAKYK